MSRLNEVVTMFLMLVSTLEATVQESDVTFYLYTKENLNSSVMIDKENPNINPDDTIAFFIHGVSSSVNEYWYEPLRNILLARQDKNYSIIEVDWSKPSSELYPFAAYNTQSVGAIIAQFIIKLNTTYGISVENFQIYGHSLGAHVAGFTGKNLLKSSLKLPRITAMDAAGIMFEGVLFSDNDRLNKNDADVVIGIHSDGGVLGYSGSYGTVDFYPNGGKALQPGCPDDPSGYCSHARSNLFLIDALQHPNTLVGTQCGNYLYFNLGSCQANKKLDMGGEITADDAGDYFLETNKEEPYGQGP